jgi:DNA topoisomerase-1
MDGDGRTIEVRIGKYGPFLTNGTQRATVPESIAPDELDSTLAVELLNNASREPESLGLDPQTGEPIFLKTGPYGPYVQRGSGSNEERPKMVSLLSNMSTEQINLDTALKLLSLPRKLGEHPTLGSTVVAATGRFGPYVKCDKETRSIPLDQLSPLEITLEQAVELLNQPKGKSRSSAKPTPLRELGKHPITEAQLTIMTGRYGPYVTDGTLNASLPRGKEPDEVTMDEAMNLLEARAGRTPKPRTRRKKKK